MERVETAGRVSQEAEVTVDPGPLVTIVVPARNEQDNIRGCLRTILDQDFTDFELIVVDGKSSDKTPEIVSSMAAADPRIRLLYNPHAVIPRSLNIALAAARGRWLVRVDAHAKIPRDYVGLAVERLASGSYGAVGGRKNGVGRTAAGRAIAVAMASPFGVGNSTYHYGQRPQSVEHVPFGAYPVEVARELGGWDERLSVNQDFEFDHRLRTAGHEILFDPKLVIDWECRQSIRDVYAQYKRYGHGKVAVAVLHPASLRARHLMAPALVTSWVLAAALLPRRPAAAVGLSAPYIAAAAAATVAAARRMEDREARRFVGPAFVAMHAGWGLGFWSGVVRTVARGGRPPAAPPPLFHGVHPGSVGASQSG